MSAPEERLDALQETVEINTTKGERKLVSVVRTQELPSIALQYCFHIKKKSLVNGCTLRPGNSQMYSAKFRISII
jgi:hypothetical protein